MNNVFNPPTPEESAIKGAKKIYNNLKDKNFEFKSQCLGFANGYLIDIVNSPRDDEDDLPENKCEDYLAKRSKNLIELDRDGNLVRIFSKK